MGGGGIGQFDAPVSIRAESPEQSDNNATMRDARKSKLFLYPPCALFNSLTLDIYASSLRTKLRIEIVSVEKGWRAGVLNPKPNIVCARPTSQIAPRLRRSSRRCFCLRKTYVRIMQDI